MAAKNARNTIPAWICRSNHLDPHVMCLGETDDIKVEVTGIPTPKVKFFLGGREVKNGSLYSIRKSRFVYTLTIIKATEEINEKEFVVTATNSAGADVLELDIKVYRILRADVNVMRKARSQTLRAPHSAFVRRRNKLRGLRTGQSLCSLGSINSLPGKRDSHGSSQYSIPARHAQLLQMSMDNDEEVFVDSRQAAANQSQDAASYYIHDSSYQGDSSFCELEDLESPIHGAAASEYGETHAPQVFYGQPLNQSFSGATQRTSTEGRMFKSTEDVYQGYADPRFSYDEHAGERMSTFFNKSTPALPHQSPVETVLVHEAPPGAQEPDEYYLWRQQQQRASSETPQGSLKKKKKKKKPEDSEGEDTDKTKKKKKKKHAASASASVTDQSFRSEVSGHNFSQPSEYDHVYQNIDDMGRPTYGIYGEDDLMRAQQQTEEVFPPYGENQDEPKKKKKKRRDGSSKERSKSADMVETNLDAQFSGDRQSESVTADPAEKDDLKKKKRKKRKDSTGKKENAVDHSLQGQPTIDSSLIGGDVEDMQVSSTMKTDIDSPGHLHAFQTDIDSLMHSSPTSVSHVETDIDSYMQATVDSPTHQEGTVIRTETDIDAVTGHIETDIDSSVHRIETDIDSPVYRVETDIDSHMHRVETDIDSHMHRVETDIDSPIHHVETDIHSPVDRVETDIDSPVHRVETDIDSPVHRVETDIDSPVHRVETDIDSHMHRVETDIDSPVHHVETDIDSPVDRVETDIDSPVHRVETDIDSPVDRVETDIDSPAHRVETDIDSPMHRVETDIDAMMHMETDPDAQTHQMEKGIDFQQQSFVDTQVNLIAQDPHQAGTVPDQQQQFDVDTSGTIGKPKKKKKKTKETTADQSLDNSLDALEDGAAEKDRSLKRKKKKVKEGGGDKSRDTSFDALEDDATEKDRSLKRKKKKVKESSGDKSMDNSFDALEDVEKDRSLKRKKKKKRDGSVEESAKPQEEVASPGGDTVLDSQEQPLNEGVDVQYSEGDTLGSIPDTDLTGAVVVATKKKSKKSKDGKTKKKKHASKDPDQDENRENQTEVNPEVTPFQAPLDETKEELMASEKDVSVFLDEPVAEKRSSWLIQEETIGVIQETDLNGDQMVPESRTPETKVKKKKRKSSKKGSIQETSFGGSEEDILTAAKPLENDPDPNIVVLDIKQVPEPYVRDDMEDLAYTTQETNVDDVLVSMENTMPTEERKQKKRKSSKKLDTSEPSQPAHDEDVVLPPRDDANEAQTEPNISELIVASPEVGDSSEPKKKKKKRSSKKSSASQSSLLGSEEDIIAAQSTEPFGNDQEVQRQTDPISDHPAEVFTNDIPFADDAGDTIERKKKTKKKRSSSKSSLHASKENIVGQDLPQAQADGVNDVQSPEVDMAEPGDNDAGIPKQDPFADSNVEGTDTNKRKKKTKRSSSKSSLRSSKENILSLSMDQEAPQTPGDGINDTRPTEADLVLPATVDVEVAKQDDIPFADDAAPENAETPKKKRKKKSSRSASKSSLYSSKENILSVPMDQDPPQSQDGTSGQQLDAEPSVILAVDTDTIERKKKKKKSKSASKSASSEDLLSMETDQHATPVESAQDPALGGEVVVIEEKKKKKKSKKLRASEENLLLASEQPAEVHPMETDISGEQSIQEPVMVIPDTNLTDEQPKKTKKKKTKKSFGSKSSLLASEEDLLALQHDQDAIGIEGMPPEAEQPVYDGQETSPVIGVEISADTTEKKKKKKKISSKKLRASKSSLQASSEGLDAIPDDGAVVNVDQEADITLLGTGDDHTGTLETKKKKKKKLRASKSSLQASDEDLDTVPTDGAPTDDAPVSNVGETDITVVVTTNEVQKPETKKKKTKASKKLKKSTTSLHASTEELDAVLPAAEDARPEDETLVLVPAVTDMPTAVAITESPDLKKKKKKKRDLSKKSGSRSSLQASQTSLQGSEEQDMLSVSSDQTNPRYSIKDIDAVMAEDNLYGAPEVSILPEADLNGTLVIAAEDLTSPEPAKKKKKKKKSSKKLTGSKSSLAASDENLLSTKTEGAILLDPPLISEQTVQDSEVFVTMPEQVHVKLTQPAKFKPVIKRKKKRSYSRSTASETSSVYSEQSLNESFDVDKEMSPMPGYTAEFDMLHGEPNNNEQPLWDMYGVQMSDLCLGLLTDYQKNKMAASEAPQPTGTEEAAAEAPEVVNKPQKRHPSDDPDYLQQYVMHSYGVDEWKDPLEQTEQADMNSSNASSLLSEGSVRVLEQVVPGDQAEGESHPDELRRTSSAELDEALREYLDPDLRVTEISVSDDLAKQTGVQDMTLQDDGVPESPTCRPHSPMQEQEYYGAAAIPRSESADLKEEATLTISQIILESGKEASSADTSPKHAGESQTTPDKHVPKRLEHKYHSTENILADRELQIYDIDTKNRYHSTENILSERKQRAKSEDREEFGSLAEEGMRQYASAEVLDYDPTYSRMLTQKQRAKSTSVLSYGRKKKTPHDFVSKTVRIYKGYRTVTTVDEIITEIRKPPPVIPEVKVDEQLKETEKKDNEPMGDAQQEPATVDAQDVFQETQGIVEDQLIDNSLEIQDDDKTMSPPQTTTVIEITTSTTEVITESTDKERNPSSNDQVGEVTEVSDAPVDTSAEKEASDEDTFSPDIQHEQEQRSPKRVTISEEITVHGDASSDSDTASSDNGSSSDSYEVNSDGENDEHVLDNLWIGSLGNYLKTSRVAQELVTQGLVLPEEIGLEPEYTESDEYFEVEPEQENSEIVEVPDQGESESGQTKEDSSEVLAEEGFSESGQVEIKTTFVQTREVLLPVISGDRDGASDDDKEVPKRRVDSSSDDEDIIEAMVYDTYEVSQFKLRVETVVVHEKEESGSMSEEERGPSSPREQMMTFSEFQTTENDTLISSDILLPARYSVNGLEDVPEEEEEDLEELEQLEDDGSSVDVQPTMFLATPPTQSTSEREEASADPPYLDADSSPPVPSPSTLPPPSPDTSKMFVERAFVGGLVSNLGSILFLVLAIIIFHVLNQWFDRQEDWE